MTVTDTQSYTTSTLLQHSECLNGKGMVGRVVVVNFRSMIQHLLCSVLFVCCWLVTAISISDCTDGTWIRGGDDFLSEIRANMSYGRGYKERNPKDWLHGSCSVSDASASCYFVGHPVTEELERREFVANDSTKCLPFSKEKFFQLIANRKLLLVGDSITRQLWANIVCMLEGHNASLLSSLQVANRYSHSNQEASWKNHHPPYTGTAIFEKYRAIVEISMIPYSWSWPAIVWKHYLEHAAAKHDIIVFNLGTHYNTEALYREVLDPIRQVFDGIALDKNLTARMPTILFMETPPQHFNTDDGNYQPKVNKEYVDQRKFRHILNEIFGRPFHNHNRTSDGLTTTNATADLHHHHLHHHHHYHQSNNHQFKLAFVPIVAALSSQYDVHRDISVSLDFIDCVHYCSEGGAPRYMVRALMNTIYSLHLPPVTNEEFVLALSTVRRHGLLIRPQKGKSVAILINSTKHAMSSGHVFDKRGYDWSAIMTVGQEVWDNLSQGENIND